MSEDLTSILDDIVSTSVRRRRRYPPPPPRYTAPPPRYTAPPRPEPKAEPWKTTTSTGYGSFSVSSPMVADLKNDTAVVSVNPAKCCIVLRARVNSTLLNEIRATLGPDKLLLNYDRSCYEFHPACLPQLQEILGRHYGNVTVIAPPKPVPPTKFDKLMSLLDKEDKAKIYRLLASRYHPDRGGSNDVMSLINEVFK